MLSKVATVLLFAGLSALAAGQAKTVEDAHSPRIQGLSIGMTAQEVLDALGRMPDDRKDEGGEILVFWKTEGGDILQVRFRDENYVSFLGLQYRPPRPTNDFMLLPLHTSSTSPLTAQDPRLRRDYKRTETADQQRTVWTRRESAEGGYRVEVSFLSGERKRLGQGYEGEVEYKYVFVAREDVKKFDQAMRARR